MKKSDIPVYNDPEDFQNGEDVKYPCDTQYMEYNPLHTHYTSFIIICQQLFTYFLNFYFI